MTTTFDERKEAIERLVADQVTRELLLMVAAFDYGDDEVAKEHHAYLTALVGEGESPHLLDDNSDHQRAVGIALGFKDLGRGPRAVTPEDAKAQAVLDHREAMQTVSAAVLMLAVAAPTLERFVQAEAQFDTVAPILNPTLWRDIRMNRDNAKRVADQIKLAKAALALVKVAVEVFQGTPGKLPVEPAQG